MSLMNSQIKRKKKALNAIEKDRAYMQSALAMARRGLGQTSSNPSVGAIIVSHDERGDKIIARAVTGRGGTPHAEPQAIATAGKGAKGATLYITLEPCNHHGRTPPCTEAIIKAGIKRVVIGTTDKDPRVQGKGINRLKEQDIAVETGVLEKQADEMNAGHFMRQSQNRPFTLLKMAVASDHLIKEGTAAGPEQGPKWVTSPLARARAALIRAEVDAILIGTNTALVDNPALTCRLKGLEARSPRPVILDKTLRLPDTLQLFDPNRELRPLVIHSNTLPAEKVSDYAKRNVQLVAVASNETDPLDLVAANQALSSLGITRLLIEGGPMVAKSYLTQDLVDEMIIFQGAKPAGPNGALPFADKPLSWGLKEHLFELYREQQLGNNIMRHYHRKQTS